jgi:hypothetical protein
MLVNNGLIVIPSRKSVISLLVDHAGLLEQLKLCQIDFVLLQAKPSRLESPLRIYSHAVDSLVVLDATEDSLEVLGAISRTRDSLLVIFSETITGAVHTLLLLAIIMSMENMVPVELVRPPLNVLRLAQLNPIVSINLIRSMPLILTQSAAVNHPSRLKLWPMVQLRLLSQFMKISFPTRMEFINIPQDLNLEDMPSRSLDGELKMIPSIGWLLTLGMRVGETRDSSKFFVDQTIVVLKVKSLQEQYRFDYD